MRSWAADWETELTIGSRPKRRERRIRNAVLVPRRGQAVPVDDGRLRSLVAKEDVEISVCRQRKAVLAIRLHEAEDVGRTAFDFDAAPNDPQDI
jgi:hypothetical protein